MRKISGIDLELHIIAEMLLKPLRRNMGVRGQQGRILLAVLGVVAKLKCALAESWIHKLVKDVIVALATATRGVAGSRRRRRGCPQGVVGSFA